MTKKKNDYPFLCDRSRHLNLLPKRLEILGSHQSGQIEALEKANLSLEETRHSLNEMIQKIIHYEHCVQETETTYQKHQ